MADVFNYDQLIQDDLNPQESDAFDYSEIVGSVDNTATTNLYNTKNSDPGKAAKSLDLVEETGLPADTIERNYDDIARKAEGDKNNELINKSPALSRWLSNAPENAKVASDDIPVLDSVWKGLTGWFSGPIAWEDRTPEEQQAILDLRNRKTGDYERTFVAGILRDFIGAALEGSGVFIEASGQELERAVTGSIANPEGDYISDAIKRAGRSAKFLGDLIDIPEERKNLKTEIVSATGQVTGQAATAYVNPVGSAMSLYAMGSDQMAQREDITGDSSQLRNTKILFGALGTGLSEKIQLDRLLKIVPSEKLFPFILDKFKAGGGEAVQEALEALWHDTVAAIGTKDIDLDIYDWDGLVKQSQTAFGAAFTFRTMFEVMLPGKARGGNVVAAEARVEKYKKIKDVVLESQTFKRHKGKFEDYVDTTLEDETDPDIYLDATEVQTFFQDRDESPQEVMQQLGVSPEAFSEAITTGGDVKVPLSKYLTLADTEYYDPLLQDIRTNQGDETLREAVTASDSKAQDIIDEADRIKAESENAADLTAQGQEVRDLVKSQLMATNKFDSDTSDRYAALHEAFAVTLSAELGVTPMEAYRKAAGLRVQAGLSPAEQNKAYINNLRKFKAPSDKRVYGESLIQYLAGKGGVDDTGGELSARDADKAHVGKPGQKKLVTKGGMSLDGALEAAIEGGYITGEPGQLTEQDLLDAIDKELAGKPVYSPNNINQPLSDVISSIDSARDELGRQGINIDKATDQEINEALFGVDVMPGTTYSQDPKDTTLDGIQVGEITDEEYETHFSPANAQSGSQSEADFRTIEGRQVRSGFIDETQARTVEGDLLKLHRGALSPLEPVHFERESLGKNTDYAASGLGVWLSTDPEVASGYGTVEQFNLDIRNPKQYTTETFPELETLDEYYAHRESLIAEGYDGITIDHSEVEGGVDYVAFNADQVINPPTETYFQQKEQAQRNHIGLWSAVEQAVIDMPLPAWKKKTTEYVVTLSDSQEAYFDTQKEAEDYIAEKDSSELFKIETFKRSKSPANGSDIWAKLKSTQGIKKEELTWLGVEDYLKSKKKFTRDEVTSFVRNNGVNVEETVGDKIVNDTGEFNWTEKIDDDPENWAPRLDDYMYDFDNANSLDSINDDADFFDVNDWLKENLQLIKDSYTASMTDDVASELESTDDLDAALTLIENSGYDITDDIKSMMHDDFEAAATEDAETEYMQDPYIIYTDEATGYIIRGNDDIGYALNNGQLGGFGDDTPYSFAEAEVQARAIAFDDGAFTDEEDIKAARWYEYVMDGKYENYRELKLTLPNVEGKGSEDSFYNDVHFPDRNVVAFLRVEDRKLYSKTISVLTEEENKEYVSSAVKNLRTEYNKLLEDLPSIEKESEQVVRDAYAARGKEVDEKRIQDYTSWESIVSELGFDGNTASEYRNANKRMRIITKDIQHTLMLDNTVKAKLARAGKAEDNAYHIDEFQSDWHQRGRQTGYQSGEQDPGVLDEKAQVVKDKLDYYVGEVVFNSVKGEFVRPEDSRGGKYKIKGTDLIMNKADFMYDVLNTEVVLYEGLESYIPHEQKIEINKLVKERNDLLKQADIEREGVVDAPFKGDGWISLGIKRAIVDAVAQGKEALTWSDSNVLSDRWSDRYKTLYETQYDKKMPSIVKKLTKQEPVHLNLDGELHERQELGYWAIPITPELAERVRNDSFALFQKKTDAPQGQIQFPGTNEEAVITLFENSDLSTFLHESGHFFLQAYRTLAKGSPKIQKDMDAITKWMGVTDSQHIGIEEHEQFARAFEAYLLEGKAPTAELQSTFDRFRSWLLQLYRSVAGLTVNLTDEVRGVFDRMLATEEAIKEAESVTGLLPVYDSAKSAGMTEAEYEDYVRSYERATSAAQSDTDSELLKRLKREQTEAWKEERNKLRDQVLEELYSLPSNQARWFFMRGTLPNGEGITGIKPVKLSRAALIEMYGDDLDALWRELPFGKYSVWTKNEDGIHPDEIANIFGFANGDEMVRSMVATKGNLNKIAMEEAELMMRRKYGDPDSPQAIAELALETIQNQERSNFLSVELRALEKKAKVGRTPRAVIKRAAIRILNGTRVADIRPYTYMRAANKWGRKALEFATSGKTVEAADAKRKQLLNQAAYQEALKARKYVDTKVNYLKKFDSPGVRKNLERSYLDQIDSMLEAYDLKKSTSLKEIEKRASLNSWIDSQLEQGMEIIVPRDIIERARKRSYKDLPYEEFIGLVDSVRNVEFIARFKQKLLVNKDKRDFAETIDELVTTALEHNTWKAPKIGLKTTLDKSKMYAREVMASHVKMEFLLQQLDGNVPNGLWWNAVFRPIAEAEDNEIVMDQEYRTALNDIFESYGTKGRAALYKETIDTEAALGRTIKRAELLSMALNWGNVGNRTALLEGEEWTVQQVEGVLNEHMTEQDWNVMQNVFDLIDTLWPQIAEMQNELTGVVPKKVEATKIKTRFGTFNGGYFPLVADSDRNYKAYKYEEKMTVEEMFGGSFTRPSTRQGHTIERVGFGGLPVKLNLDVIGSHLINVIHDLTHRRAVLQADRILQNPEVHDAIVGVTNQETYNHIRPWLAGIASDKRPYTGWLEQTIGRLRRGATAVNMGWKFTTAIVQPLGYLQSVEVIGEKYALKGLHRFYGNPIKAKQVIEEVFSKSVMMANRSKNFDRDIRDSIRRIKGDSPYHKMQRSLFSHIGFMDYSVSIPTWIGAYEKSMDEQKAQGKQINEADAIVYADSVVRMSQSSGGAKDLAAIQRGSDFQRSFTMFYSYFSVLHNLIRKRAQISKKVGLTTANVTNTTMSMLYLVVLPAVLSELIIGRFPGDDDEDEEMLTWAATTSAAYPFMTMVGFRDFANALSSGYTYQATPLLDAAESLLKSGQAVGDAVTDLTGTTEDEFDDKDVKNMVMTAGYLFALPSRQLYTSGEHLYSVLDGEEEFSLYELLYRNRRE